MENAGIEMKKTSFNWRVVAIVFVGLMCLLLFPTLLRPVHHPPWAVSRGLMNGVSEASKHYHDEHKTGPNRWLISPISFIANEDWLIFGAVR
jgi:hypothetical protein